jgi:hypothetical protein
MKNEEYYVKLRKAFKLAREDWIWLPHAAHFIGSHFCDFRMATDVGDFIVSTVGEYHRYLTTGNREKREIGRDRYYETMIFYKKITDPNDCECCVFCPDGEEIEMIPYNSNVEAMNGHVSACDKYSQREAAKNIDYRGKELENLRLTLKITIDKIDNYNRDVERYDLIINQLKSECDNIRTRIEDVKNGVRSFSDSIK